MKHAILLLSLFLFMGLAPATMPPAFVCTRYGKELNCMAKALSDTKRAPEWELYQEGGYGWVDRARGWNVTLYPNGVANHTVVMRGYLPGVIVVLSCDTTKDSGCESKNK